MTVQINPFLAGEVSARTVSIPAGLAWPAGYGTSITLKRKADGGFTGEIDYDPFAGAAYAACIATKVYIATTGNDTTGVGTVGNPYLTPDRAITHGNAGGVPYSVYIKGASNGAVYLRTIGGQITSYPTQDCAFVAYDGTVIMGTFDDLAWSQNTATHPEISGFANVWAVARTAYSRALSLTVQDEFGAPYSLKKVTAGSDAAGIAKVNSLPGSSYNSAAKAYISLPDLQDPNLTRVRGLLTVRPVSLTNVSTAVNLFFTGETADDQMELWGGVYVGCNTPFGSQKIVAFRRVSSVGSGAADGRAFAIEGWNGISYFDQCAAISPNTDGYNLHNIAGATNPYTIIKNSTAINSGQTGNVSCQSVSFHEDCRGIVVGGQFEASHGGNVRNINTSKMLAAGATFRKDRGDFNNGVQPVEVRTDDTAEIWLDTCITDPLHGAAYAIKTSSGSNIRHRGMAFNGQPVSGNVAAY